MQLSNNLKLKFKDIQKKEEEFSTKLVHTVEKGLLPSALNLFTEIGSTFAILIILLLLAIFDGIKPVLLIFPVYFAQLIIVEAIKIVANRKRPATLNKKNRFLNLKASSGSFPSGHTSNIFSLAILLATIYEFDLITSIILFLTATLVAISRLYLGRHYLIDVLGGFVTGVIITIMIINMPFYTLLASLF